MKSNNLEVHNLPVLECPHCFIPVLLTEKNSRKAKNYMAKPHEPLDCLKFGRMLRKLNSYSVRLIKPHLSKMLKQSPDFLKIDNPNTDNFADILLQFKNNY